MTGILQVAVTGDQTPGLWPFVNMYATAIAPQLDLTAGGSVSGSALQAYMDSNYNLSSVTGCNQYEFYLFQAPPSLTGVYPNLDNIACTVTWANGTAVTGLNGLNLSNFVVNLAGKSATFTISPGAGASNIGLRFQFTTTGTGPTSIYVYQTANQSHKDAGELLDPNFVAFYTRWGCNRLMDCMQTNYSAAAAYTDIPSTSFAFWNNSTTLGGLKVGWPVAALVELANRTHKDIWVNVPHLFTSAASTSLATALAAITFVAGQKVHVAYSNETWNFGFSGTNFYGDTGQTTFCQTQGNLGTGTDAFGNTAGWETGGSSFGNQNQWAGYRAAQHMELWRAAFGSDSGTGHWQGELETFTVNTQSTTDRLTGVSHHISSDSGVPGGTTIKKLFTNGSVAPYIGPVPSNSINTGTITGGTGYTNGTYNNVPLTGGTGANATATITVSGGAVTGVTNIANSYGYFIGDNLSAAAASIGGTGTGFVFRITDVAGGSSTQDMLGWLAVSQANFNANFYAQMTATASTSSAYLSIAYYRTQWQAQATVLTASGLGIDWYEGGLGAVVATGYQNQANGMLLSTAFSLFSSTNYAGQLTFDQMTLFNSDTGGTPAQFAAMGPATKFGNWGARQTLADINQRTNAVEAWNQAAPWQQNYRNMQIVLTSS